MLGQEGRGWLLVAEGRRRRERPDGAGVVVHHPLVGRNWPGRWTCLPRHLPHGGLGLLHAGVGPISDGVHGDQRAVALGVGVVPGGLADGTGETAEDGTGDQPTGTPQFVAAALSLRLSVVETELARLSTRHGHPAP